MAYDSEILFKQAQSAISDHNLYFIEDVVAWLPCDKTTFYRHFPKDCNEYNILKKMIEDNRVRKKTEIREKLFDGKGGDLIALYKMICTDEERKALSMSYQESKQDINEEHTVIVVRDQHEKDITKAIIDDD